MSCIVRIASMPWLNVVSRFFSGVSFFAVECESEVEIDNIEGRCWIIDDILKQEFMKGYFFLCRSSEARDFQKRYILLSKSKASITSYLHIYDFKVFDPGIMHAIQMLF